MGKDVIHEEFKRVYADFLYPFKTSDKLISELSEAGRKRYYKEARAVKESPVLIQELNETCRVLYFKLAMRDEKESGDVYKGALLFASVFKKRLNDLGKNYTTAKESNEQINKINEIVPE